MFETTTEVQCVHTIKTREAKDLCRQINIFLYSRTLRWAIKHETLKDMYSYWIPRNCPACLMMYLYRFACGLRKKYYPNKWWLKWWFAMVQSPKPTNQPTNQPTKHTSFPPGSRSSAERWMVGHPIQSLGSPWQPIISFVKAKGYSVDNIDIKFYKDQVYMGIRKSLISHGLL